MNNTNRTFRAATEEAALAQVQRELGLDAVVIEVRQTSARGLLGWLSSRQQFEVTASRPARRSAATESSSTQVHSTGPSTAGTIAAAAAARKSLNSLENGISDKPANRTDSNSQAVAATARPNDQRSDADVKSKNLQRKAVSRSSDLAPPPPLLPDDHSTTNRIAETLQQAIPSAPKSAPRTDPWHNLAVDVVRSMPSMSVPTVKSELQLDQPRSDLNSAQVIEHRLDALQQMIAELSRRTQPRGLIEIPPELFPHYLTLVEADVPDEAARELIQKLVRHAAPGQLADSASTMALLTALIEQQVPCDRQLTRIAGRRQIAMVVGPTGVGKTTTLAKLAGQFGMHDGCRLGLITVDTYRVAAVEQLRTYAEIINLPMRIVANPDEMQEALDAFADFDFVLIDTAGRSPHDDRRLNELKQLIDAACPDHVYLVLSLASGANALASAAERFASVHPTSVVFTKLDEATGCGGLLGAARDIGLPISYFTTGQEVPRDIEPANPCRAARLIVGIENVNGSTSR